MKTQISRDTFDAGQRHSGVYLQQGRMILDADWNELTDIQKTRLADALRDAISGRLAPAGAIPGGAPRVGGLVVFADPAGSANIRIAPGSLYVDGVPARLDAAAPMAVNAQPEYPIGADYSGQNLLLYADVWERSVTALHDPGLMDAALHGADTATRSQTMLQVKWCPDTVDPMDPAVNPPLGDAALTLKLRSVASSGDPCDPCAAQVDVDERLGNYLFRVEVHEYVAASGTLTLKWSRDNGAEAAAVGETPPGFEQGGGVWEYFDADTERLLGNHFASNPTKLRGLIKESFGTPGGANEPKTHVRQWDGYLVVQLAGAGTLVDGRDRGVDLFMGTQADTAHGRVHVAAGTLRINLERMELTLASTGKRFVPGDHWLATVREATHESGDVVLAAAPPRGVRHHYLLLGALGVDKKLKAQDDAFRRRMAFPPLTDLVAGDIGFTDQCPGLYAGAKNVQAALDALCAIGAEDIAYRLPDCGVDEAQSIKGRLKALLDPDNDGQLTVQAALDTLLCRLTAADLPLDKTDAGLCADLSDGGVATVQDALKVLCDRAAGGCCEVPVSTSEELTKLLKAFAVDPAMNLWICLQPGRYDLKGLPPVKGQGSLRLVAQNPGTVSIDWLDEGWSLQLHELALDRLAVVMTQPKGHWSIAADAVSVQGCSVARLAAEAGGPAMLEVGGVDGRSCMLGWRDTALSAQVKKKTGGSKAWADVAVVGQADVSKALDGLLLADLSDAGRKHYDEALEAAVAGILAMPADQRLAWSVAAAPAPVRRRARAAPAAALTTRGFTEVLGRADLAAKDLSRALEDLVAAAASVSADVALRLADTGVGGVIQDCCIEGSLLFGNGIAGDSVPSLTSRGKVALQGPAVLGGGADLRLRGNRISAVMANVPPDALDPASLTLSKPVPGHARLFFDENTLLDVNNVFTATSFVGQGNTWWWASEPKRELGYVIADRASFTANLLETDEAIDIIRLGCSAEPGRIGDAGNVLVRMQSWR